MEAKLDLLSLEDRKEVERLIEVVRVRHAVLAKSLRFFTKHVVEEADPGHKLMAKVPDQGPLHECFSD